MSADDMVENGPEAAALALFRRAPPRRQRATLRALLRHVDDVEPFAECLVDAEVECGAPPAKARGEGAPGARSLARRAPRLAPQADLIVAAPRQEPRSGGAPLPSPALPSV
jgi:hypothetical protein